MYNSTPEWRYKVLFLAFTFNFSLDYIVAQDDAKQCLVGYNQTAALFYTTLCVRNISIHNTFAPVGIISVVWSYLNGKIHILKNC